MNRAKVGQCKIWEERNVKLLGINIDSQLNFNDQVSSICKKAGRKLTALIRLMKLLTIDQRRILMKSFIESQFKYCPLVWMFHSRELNNKINNLHERALQIVYKDNKSTFNELLTKDNSVSVHYHNDTSYRNV